MKDDKTLDRRAFTNTSILAMLSGVAITISGCGDDTPTKPAQPTPPPATDKSGDISGNHGHVATVTAAQQTAGGAVSLNIQGTAAHMHIVEVSAADLASIRGGTRVAVASTTTNNHTHTVTFN